MHVKHLAVALVLVGCGSLDIEKNSLAIFAGNEPVITAVHTEDGFTQIRQNATVSVVIEGKQLADAMSVSVGAFFVQVDSVAEEEVRVTVFTDSTQPLGPVDVSVTAGAGTATMARALTLTPFVVSPTAVSGHGTYESPMNLCDPELDFTSDGSVVRLLAGTHRCDRQIALGAGATVLGEPRERTIVTGTQAGGFGIAIFGFSNSTSITTFRDVTFQQPLAGPSIAFFDDGTLIVEHVVDAGGITGSSDGTVTIDRYTYEGEGTALDLLNGEVTRSTIRHCGAGDGIHVAVGRTASFGNNVSLDHVTVEDCQRGLVVGAPSAASVPVAASVTNSQFINNSTGVSIVDGNGRVGVTVRGGKIAGSRSAGIDVLHSFFLAGDQSVLLDVEGALIVGGPVGIAFQGLDNTLFVRGSTIHGQTQAALAISALDSFIDLGTPGDPGNNVLSVASGFAIDDTRFDTNIIDRYILAAGNTLNDARFDGQTIDGPAELAPYFRITSSDSGIQF